MVPEEEYVAPPLGMACPQLCLHGTPSPPPAPEPCISHFVKWIWARLQIYRILRLPSFKAITEWLWAKALPFPRLSLCSEWYFWLHLFYISRAGMNFMANSMYWLIHKSITSPDRGSLTAFSVFWPIDYGGNALLLCERPVGPNRTQPEKPL